MTYDDDALDRMLSALPLEETPPALHGRILAATLHAPAPVAPIRSWESWVIGLVVALAVWLSWLVVTQPYFVDRLGALASDLAQQSGLLSLTTWAWLAAGASAAWWVSMLTVPRTQRGRVEVR